MFPVVGAHAEEEAQCNARHCAVTMTQVTRSTAGAYKCEVSTDAPTFKVAFEAANMTIVGELSLLSWLLNALFILKDEARSLNVISNERDVMCWPRFHLMSITCLRR